jgi:WD40 repeat protein
VQKLEGHSGGVWAVAFSPDGALLALGSDDPTIRLWDTQTGQEVQKLEGHSSWVRAVAFSPDGALLASGSQDQTIRLWDTQTGQEVQKLEGHSSWVRAVAFSPNGALLASGSHDLTIRLWDTQTGREVQKLEGHSNGVNVVAFSPDGALLASGSDDQTIRLWDTQTGRTLKRLENIPTPETICFANSNMTLITNKGIFNAGNGNSLNADSIEAYKNNTISVLGDWIRRGNQNLLWLPHEYRGITTLNGGKLAIGANSGLVSIFQF